jgi:diketogulonate reductase-like aldo/keto reductase
MISSIRLAPTVRLLNGVDMPQLGLGTWPMASLNGLGRADPNMKDADEFGH